MCFIVFNQKEKQGRFSAFRRKALTLLASSRLAAQISPASRFSAAR
jgi:hypothetical protein